MKIVFVSDYNFTRLVNGLGVRYLVPISRIYWASNVFGHGRKDQIKTRYCVKLYPKLRTIMLVNNEFYIS